MRLLLALACAVAPAIPALAQDPSDLAPKGSWTLDYADDSCALRRTFGQGDDQVYLEIRRFEPNLDLQTIIASKGMNARRQGRFSYRFNTDPDWKEVSGANTVTMSSGYSGVLFHPRFLELPEFAELTELEQFNYRREHDLRTAEVRAASEVDTIILRNAFRREITLQLGQFDAPIAALNECIDELMTHWGIDTEAHKTLSRPALPVNLPEVGSMIDYPPKMIRQNLQGVVNVRLDIDATGRITGCHIQMPLSDPEFEETSCVDVQHAIDFDPALDKDGNPIPSYWVTKIFFMLG